MASWLISSQSPFLNSKVCPNSSSSVDGDEVDAVGIQNALCYLSQVATIGLRLKPLGEGEYQAVEDAVVEGATFSSRC